jgi:hypothetical protein
MPWTWRPQVAIKFFKWHPPVYMEFDIVSVFSDREFLTAPNPFT